LLCSVIPRATRTEGGCIRHDKRHACYFCQSIVTNIWRHYQVQHGTEDEVQNIMTSCVTEQKRGINKLRMSGDYYHNLQVLSQKCGQLIVVRRPSGNKTASYADFLPCSGCKGFFLRTEMWRHCKNCEFRQNSLQQSEVSCQKEGLMLIAPFWYTATTVSPPLAAVLASMELDNISLAAKNDSIILNYGAFVSQNCTASQHTYVSQRMRQLARLLIELRDANHSPDADLSSFLKPERFDTVVAAVLKVCRYEDCTKTESAKLKVPSLALKLGYALRKCCTLLVNKALREKDIALERDADSFLRIHDSEWKVRVSSIALKTMTYEKRNKPELIPLTADLVKIKQYLEASIEHLSEQASAEPSADTYVNLVDCTVSRIILFNKRRGGEVGRMTLAAYEKVRDSNAVMPSGLDDIAQTLSRAEQQLCNRLKLVEISGKRNQTVPVLLTPDAVRGIDAIVAIRDTVGIDPQNLFLFARCTGLNSVDPFAAIRKVAQCAGAARPELIRGTKLRKYMATVSQVLDMRPNELSLLCRHMGHSIHVHEDFYRLPSHTLELAKVSKLLMAVEGGNLNELTGKTMNDLDLDDIPNAHADDDDDADDDDADDDDPAVDNTNPNMQGSSKQVSHQGGGDNQACDASDVEDSIDADSDSTVPEQYQKETKSRKSVTVKLPRHRTRTCVKKPWSAAEKSALFEHFRSNVRERKVPGKNDCENAKKRFPILSSRSWKVIKFAVKNIITKEKKLAV